MRTLEDRLTQASDEARLQVNQIDTRSATSIRSRQQRSRTLVGTVAVAAMFIVFGATALVMSTQTGQDSASEPGTTAAPVAVAEASAPAVPNDELPRLGVVSDDWAVVEAVDTGNGTTLIYAGNPEVYGGEAEQPRLSIQVWSDEPGEESGSGYRHALSSLTAKEEQLADTRLNDGTTARTFAYADLNSGNLGYYFLWQHSDTVTVEVIAFVRQLDDAQAVVSSIESLAGAEWEEIQEILVDQRTDAAGSTTPTTVATGGSDETGSATTTTIVADNGILPSSPLPTEIPFDLVTSRTTASEAPPVFVCGQEPSNGESIENGTTFRTPANALWGFLRESVSIETRPGFLTSGYTQIELPDGSIAFANFFEGDRAQSVTTVYITATDGAWAVAAWEGSGC